MASPGCQQHKPRSGVFVGKSWGSQGQTHHAGPIPGAGGAAWKAFSAPDPKKKLCPHPQAHQSQTPPWQPPGLCQWETEIRSSLETVCKKTFAARRPQIPQIHAWRTQGDAEACLFPLA